MFFYSWTALTGMTDDIPATLGISDSREKAQRDAGEALLDGRAFIAIIDTVRPVMAAYGLAPCYLRTGASWLGRRDRSGQVVWQRFHYRPGGSDITGTDMMGL
jgi:hypothetical protein